MTIPNERMQQIYQAAKEAYEQAHSLEEDSAAAHAAGHEFDHFIAQLTQPPAPQRVDENGLPVEEPTHAQQLMELIIEIDRAVEIVPPKLSRYRALLVHEGLDQVPVKPEADADSMSSGSGVQTGMSMPGINLADQAALAYHSQLLGLAFSVAQAEVASKYEQG